VPSHRSLVSQRFTWPVAYHGTGPIEVSSGERKIHRLSLRGNRRPNHAIHMAAVTQIRHKHNNGRAYFEKKIAEARPAKKRSARSNASSATPSTSGSRPTPPAARPHKLTVQEGSASGRNGSAS
jgi:hypothetical protein